MHDAQAIPRRLLAMMVFFVELHFTVTYFYMTFYCTRRKKEGWINISMRGQGFDGSRPLTMFNLRAGLLREFLKNIHYTFPADWNLGARSNFRSILMVSVS